MQEYTNTPSHTHFATRILNKMIRFLSIVPVINWRRFNGNVLTNSETFRFGGILTLGLFDVHTHRLKAEPGVRHCGEFDFMVSKFNKKPRISEFGFRIRGEDLCMLFHFQKQAGIHKRLLVNNVDHHR